MQNDKTTRVLVIGWFTFAEAPSTAGDVLAAQVVADWLRSAQIQADLAMAGSGIGRFDFKKILDISYTHVVAVCGPHFPGVLMKRLPPKLRQAKYIGIDLSIMEPLPQCSSLEFDALFERDSNRITRPELAFVSEFRPVPLVGLLLVHPQPEYGSRARHDVANRYVNDMLARQSAAVISIDTLLHGNTSGFRTPEQIETAIATMDCVVTTRLHGTVLALKHAVPALAIDPIAGGAKIAAQCKIAGWPVCLDVERLDTDSLQAAFNFCLSNEARAKAATCAELVKPLLGKLRREFLSVFGHGAVDVP